MTNLYVPPVTPFSIFRPNPPMCVHIAEANKACGAGTFPMVTAGGGRLMREDFFDNAARSDRIAGIFVGGYASAMMGGEPFSTWY